MRVAAVGTETGQSMPWSAWVTAGCRSKICWLRTPICLKTRPIRQTVAVAIAVGLYNRAIAQRSTASLDYGATTRRT